MAANLRRFARQRPDLFSEDQEDSRYGANPNKRSNLIENARNQLRGKGLGSVPSNVGYGLIQGLEGAKNKPGPTPRPQGYAHLLKDPSLAAEIVVNF